MSTNEPDLLLDHVRFLRALARGLLGDPHQAEDVVQETLATSLARPPRDRRNVRGWLAVVARNLAFRVGRDRRRRARREERAARRDALPSAAELAARAELQRRVVAAVNGLEEPYRSTIHYRYFDGLAPREIAARQGIPVKTVKTRLSRALALLRSKLDGAYGEDRRAWTAILAPLAASRPPVIAEDAPGGGAGLTAGGALVVLKQALLVMAVVLVAAVLVDRTARGPVAPPERGPEVELPPPLRASGGAAAPSPGAEPAEEEEPSPEDGARPAPADPAEPVRVIVLGPGDAPLEGVRIHLAGKPEEAVATGADGSVALPWEPAGGKLTIVASGIVPWTSTAIDRAALTVPEVTLRFPDLVGLTVEVVDAVTGVPLTGARVLLKAGKAEPLPLPPVRGGYGVPVSPVRRGKKEKFTVIAALPGGYALAGGSSVEVSGTISRFAEHVVVTLVGWPGARVRVVVTEADGRPAAGAIIHRSATIQLFEAMTMRTGPDGEAEIHNVPAVPGETVRTFVSKGGRMAQTSAGRIGRNGEEVVIRAVLPATPRRLVAFRGSRALAGTAGEFSFVDTVVLRGFVIAQSGLVKTAGLDVLVTRRSGAPAAGVKVVVYGSGRPSASARTRSDGTASFSGLKPGEALVAVREPGFLMGPPVGVALADGVTSSAEVREARGGRLRVLVLADDGLPAPFATLTVSPAGSVPYTRLEGGVQRLVLLTDGDGRAELDDLPPGEATITASLGTRRKAAKAGPGGYLEIVLPKAR